MKKIISFVLAMVVASSLFVSASARLVGDVDSDGKATSSDALLILRYSVGSVTEINTKYADINNDGSVNSSDALSVLQICVGSYTGALEIDDEAKTLKETLIDSVMATKKFTIVTSVEESGSTIPVTIMIDGSNMATEMTYSGVTMRIVVLNGKTYCVLPKFLMGMTVYGTLVGDDDLSFGEFGAIDGLEFVKTETVTVSGKTYTKETYKLPGNTEYSYTEYCYYFLGNEWKILETISHTSTIKNGERVWVTETDTQPIDTFKAGVDASYFKLTGTNIGEIDLSDYA